MHNHLPSPVKYREDINGLRAWAVIAVLLFHFSLIGLPGGFVGVDIFFVISGYLMTAIVISGYEKRNFSILMFYMSRVRRIVPALLVVITVLLLFGWYWLSSIDYQTLGSQSVAALTFLSNMFFWKQAGYFDASSHEKWLLHTWSLAVEAQFYILYPLLIMAVLKIWKTIQSVVYAVILVFILSLMLNLVLAKLNPSAAFYFLPTRSWELLSGALVYLAIKHGLSPKQYSTILYWLGWLLLISSFVLMNESLVWPNYWALLPVIGTSLILLINNENCILTKNTLAQWLGDRSYSLYLWHWPMVVALLFLDLQSEWLFVIFAFSLSLLLAHLSYHFIEIPTRSLLSKTSFVKEFILIGLLTTGLIVLALFIRFQDFQDRVPGNVDQASAERINWNPLHNRCLNDIEDNVAHPNCRYLTDPKVPVGVISLGDSHNNALFTSVGKAAQNNDLNAQYWSKKSCPFILGAEYASEPLGSSCEKFNLAVAEKIKIYTGVPLVLIARWNEAIHPLNENTNIKPTMKFQNSLSDDNDVYLDYRANGFLDAFKNHYINTVCNLTKDHPVYLVRPIPEIGIDVPRFLSRKMMFDKNFHSDIKINLSDYMKRSRVVWDVQNQAAKTCGAVILNPLPYLCDEKYCYGSKDGRPLYSDDNHLSEYGNTFLIPMFEQVFKK
jgi:peptidoglycan/LPS O-acetylase OafA/YrhL